MSMVPGQELQAPGFLFFGLYLMAPPAGVHCEQLWAVPTGAEGAGMGCGGGAGWRSQGSCLSSTCHWLSAPWPAPEGSEGLGIAPRYLWGS